MPDYRIFGDVLRSQLILPELVPGDSQSPRWVLSKVEHPTALVRAECIGREEVDQGVTATLSRHSNGLRLAFDDTGVFDISGDGHQILWAPPEAPDMDAVRKDVLGRVFALALDQAGIASLHGSAVALGPVAVAFLAPKFHGKSTTATALVNSGGQLLADDIVAITCDDEPTVLPSVPVVQLWRDSAEQVVGSASASSEVSSPKLQVAWQEESRNASNPVPLGALYLLVPMESRTDNTVRRDRMSEVEAAVALLGQGKVATLLGVERRAGLLKRLAELVERVPVYRLLIPRDFGRIGELTSSLMTWHSASGNTGFAGRSV